MIDFYDIHLKPFSMSIAILSARVKQQTKHHVP